MEIHQILKLACDGNSVSVIRVIINIRHKSWRFYFLGVAVIL